MNTRQGMSLAERSARSGVGDPSALAKIAAAQEVTPHHQARHCWVVDAPMSPGKFPGVLLQWRRHGLRGWQGLAVWAADDEDGPVLLQAWLDARHLEAGQAG